MQLLVIRHGVAEERDVFAKSGKDDDLRPLTTDGKRKMRKGAKGIRALVTEVDVLASSPLIRARQTADIVAMEYENHPIVTVDSLRPERPFEDFVSWASAEKKAGTIAIVGHEPHLSALVTWLLTGEKNSKITLKKGGACLLEFEGRPAKAAGSLCWLATPAMLRA